MCSLKTTCIIKHLKVPPPFCIPHVQCGMFFHPSPKLYVFLKVNCYRYIGLLVIKVGWPPRLAKNPG